MQSRMNVSGDASNNIFSPLTRELMRLNALLVEEGEYLGTTYNLCVNIFHRFIIKIKEFI